MRKLSDIQSFVTSALRSTFPHYTVTFEQLEDDPYMIGVGVYGVEPELVQWVEDKVMDLDRKLSGFVLVPLVRDKETTRRYYPELASPWHAVNSRIALDASFPVTIVGSQLCAGRWFPGNDTPLAAYSEELALAV